MSEPEVLLRKLTRREFRQRMQSAELKACLIPIAAVEQHLEHLAMEHDWRSVCHVAVAVAERLRPRVLVVEGLLAGISEHHMRHPGTLSLQPGTFLSVLSDLIDSVVRAGFKNVLVLNGHGGNIAACRATWDQFLRLYQVNLQFLSYWDVMTEADAKALLQSAGRVPGQRPHRSLDRSTRSEARSRQRTTRPGVPRPDRGTRHCLSGGNDRRQKGGRHTTIFPLTSAFTSSPRDAGVGRGDRRGEPSQNVPPLPCPLLPPMEERAFLRLPLAGSRARSPPADVVKSE